ncbi:hypothetical protein P0M11_06220 [Kaistella sp. PBT33-4]|uniref:hypothetical protein n=1 Tax=Kaistella sp. PBT33-4 TaxID=3032000 RepID=UPI0023D85127|nr:hypothetical protein [Kaistella sp. PBT33-4]MDF0719594.1 hypothetical protein [Kaistella sp. PBT33-4]
MSTQFIKRDVYLLPNGFKMVGVAVILLSLALFILQTQGWFPDTDHDFRIAVTLLLTGLALINISKEKIEDERIKKIRYRTWAYSLQSIIGLVVFGRILNSFLEEPLEYFNSSSAILIVTLLLNLIYFATSKEVDYDKE